MIVFALIQFPICMHEMLFEHTGSVTKCMLLHTICMQPIVTNTTYIIVPIKDDFTNCDYKTLHTFCNNMKTHIRHDDLLNAYNTTL